MVVVVIYFLVFMCGAASESALNCFLYRMDKNLDWVRGHSVCELCGARLLWWELIPVFSCLFLRGKCSHCHGVFGYRHMCLEILAGVMAMFVFYIQTSLGASFITTCVVCIVGFGVLSVLSDVTAHR